MMRRFAFILLLSLAAPVFAQSGGQSGSGSAQKRETFSQDDLRRVEKARDEALKRLKALETASQAAERETSAIDADLLAAAADTTRREEAASRAELRLIELGIEMQDARASLLSDEATLEDLLAALMSFGSRRPPALAASPEDAGSAVRAAILMGETAPALAARAQTLRDQIRTLNALAEETRNQTRRLEIEEAALTARREEIEALAAEKRLSTVSLAAETRSLRAETERLAKEAETLRDLLDGLAKAAPDAPGRKPASRPPAAGRELPGGKVATARPPSAQGAPLPPAVGTRLAGFGQTVDGLRQEGVTFETRPSAQVVAPLDARVQYAGIFRSYGQMLILDVGSDVLVIVSGLDALYPEAGQWVLAGEPVGRMSDQKSPSPELYLEVRRRGQPVDPEKWLGQNS